MRTSKEKKKKKKIKGRKSRDQSQKNLFTSALIIGAANCLLNIGISLSAAEAAAVSRCSEPGAGGPVSAHRRGSRFWAPIDPRSTARGKRPGSPPAGQAESQELPLRHARSPRASRGTGKDPIQRIPVTWDRDERMRHKDAPGENKKPNKETNPQTPDPSSSGCRTAPPRRRASTGIGKSLPGRARRGSRWCL